MAGNIDNLISRQAAIDAVEESRRLNHHEDGKEACAHEYEHRHFLKILRDLPIVEPQIIRCKDCKHRDKFGCCKHWEGWAQGDMPIATDDNDFCSYAEQR